MNGSYTCYNTGRLVNLPDGDQINEGNFVVDYATAIWSCKYVRSAEQLHV